MNTSLLPRRISRRICHARVAAALLALPTVSWASSFFWTGDNNVFWNATAGANGTNWSSLAGANSGTLGLPGAGDDVFFNIPGAGNLSTILGQNFSIQSLTFLPVATNPVTIGGANTLTIGTGGLTNNSNGTMTLDANVALGTTQTWTNNTPTTVTVNGIISGAGSGLTIAGSGAFNFTNANTYSGSTTVFTGTLNLSGANGAVQNTSAIALGAGTVLNLNSAGANHTTQDRIADSTPITSNGGFINLLGNSSAATSETLGTLTTGSGATYVNVTPGVGQTATLTFGAAGSVPSFNHVIGGTVTFSNTGTIMAPNVTLVNPTNPIIGGWATIGTVSDTVSNTFNWATVNVANQIAPLATYQPLTSAPLSTDNAQGTALTDTVTLAGGNNSVNTLSFNGSNYGLKFTNNTDVLTIVSGGIFSNDGTGTGNYDNKTATPRMTFVGSPDSGIANVGGTVAYNGRITSGFFPTDSTAELDVFTTATGNLRLYSVIQDPDGTHQLTLVKSGPGLLDLSGGNTQNNKTANTFTGKVVINEGVLLINIATNLGNPAAGQPDTVIFNGGELRTFAGLNTTAGNGWTVGTRGGVFTYTGGGTTNIQNKITGVGGFTYYSRAFGGGTNEIITLANALGAGGTQGNNDYQGSTNLWISLSTDQTQFGRIGWNRDNQIPATSAVTLSVVDDTPAHNQVNNANLAGNPASVNLANANGNHSDHFGSLAGNLNIRNFNGTLTIGANNLSTTYTGSLYGNAAQALQADTSFPAGTGTLTKVGSGTQTFAGTRNLYTGATNINGGTLLIGSGTTITSSASLGSGPVNVGNGTLVGALGGNGTISGPVTVSSTGHLAPAMSATTTNTLTLSNSLTINAGATFDYHFGTAGTPGTSDLINLIGTGAMLMNAGVDILNITPLSGFGVGTYNLITMSGSGAFTDNATFTINGSTLFNYSVLKPGDPIDAAAGGGTVPAGQLRLQVLTGNPSFFWAGAVNGTWDVNTTANWTGAGSKFTTGGNVTFDDVNLSTTPPGATNITVAPGGVTANSIVFENGVNNYTIGGAAITVTAGAGITKNQAGTVTLNGNVTTPRTTITAGTLSVGATGTLNSALIKVSGGTLSVAGALGASTALNVAGVATFTGAAQTIGSLGNDSGVTSGIVNLNGPTTLTIGTGAYDGLISGPGGITKNTTAVLTLTNPGNNFTGNVTIANGALSVPIVGPSGTPQPLGASLNPIVLGSAATTGTLQYTGNTASTNQAFTVAVAGGGIEVTTVSQVLTLDGAINNGANPLTLLGAGDGLITTALAGAGNIIKQGTGTWALGNQTTATASTSYDIQGGTLAGESDGIVNSLGAATVTLSGGTLGLSASSAAIFDNAVNVSQNSTITAFQSVPAGGLTNQDITLGSATNGITIAAGRTVTLSTANGDTLNIAGNITGSGSVTANGTVNINGVINGYTGATTIAGGTVNASTTINGTASVTANGGTFNISGGLVTTGAMTANGGTINVNSTVGTGAVVVSGGTINANATVTSSDRLQVNSGIYNGFADLAAPNGVTINGGTARIVAPTNGAGNTTINIASGLLQFDAGFGNTATFGGTSVTNDGLIQVSSGIADLGNIVITTNKPHSTPGIAEQLAESYFRPSDVGAANFANNGGDPYITFENIGTFLTRPPGGRGTLTNTNLNFTGAQIQGRTTPAGIFPTTDNEGTAWLGQLTVGGPNLPAGPISFGTNSDDGSSLYIDLNRDGVFQFDERIISNLGSHGVVTVTNTVTLAAGTYNFAIGWYNGNGGQQIDARFAAGTGVPYASQAFINPGSGTQLGVFTGPVTPGGSLEIDSDAELQLGGFTADAVNFTGTNGTLTFKNNASAVISAADSLNLQGLSTQASLNLGTNNTANIVKLNLGMSGLVTKSGNGSLVITGAGAGTGSVSVLSGPLIVNGSIAGAVTISGGTLKGVGTVGQLTLATGTLAPGGSAGILNSGALALSGGTLAIEITGASVGAFDQVNVTGGVSLNAPTELTLDFSAYLPVENVDSFMIVANDSNDPVSFGGPAALLVFNGTPLTEGTRFTATSGAFTQDFKITYSGGDGNDIVLAAIPEPGSALSLLSGFCLLVGLRGMRRRR
jgi:fibronectin-binding autotransporter adhesin